MKDGSPLQITTVIDIGIVFKQPTHEGYNEFMMKHHMLSTVTTDSTDQ